MINKVMQITFMVPVLELYKSKNSVPLPKSNFSLFANL